MGLVGPDHHHLLDSILFHIGQVGWEIIGVSHSISNILAREGGGRAAYNIYCLVFANNLSYMNYGIV